MINGVTYYNSTSGTEMWEHVRTSASSWNQSRSWLRVLESSIYHKYLHAWAIS